MVKKLFSWIFSDFHWKLLAFFGAWGLWFAAMHFNDPPVNQSVTQSLQLSNIEILAREGIIVLNEDELLGQIIQVGVRGLRSDVEGLLAAITSPVRQEQMIEVSIDFRAIDVEAVRAAEGVIVQTLRVSPNISSGFEQVSITPSYVYIHLDAETRLSMPVSIVEEGITSPGFERQPTSLNHSHTTVIGARSVLKTVTSVQAHIDFTGIHGEEFATVNFQVINEHGEDISDQVRLSVMETNAAIRVWAIQSRAIRVQETGSIAQGFAVSEIEHFPQSVYVVGSEAALYGLEYIQIEVDVSGATSDFLHTVYLEDWLPSGVRLPGGESQSITIAGTVEPIQVRRIDVPRDTVRIHGVTAIYQIMGNATNIQVNVSGPRTRINALSAAGIGLELDLRGFPAGTHTIPLRVILPAGLIATNVPTITVQISAPAAESDDDYDGYATELITLPPLPPPPELPPEPYTEPDENDYPGEDDYPDYPAENFGYPENHNDSGYPEEYQPYIGSDNPGDYPQSADDDNDYEYNYSDGD